MLRLIPGSKYSELPLNEGRRDEFSELARAVVGGDRIAQKTFLTAVVPHLLRVVRRVLGPDHREVERVTHVAAYAVLDRLPHFRGYGTVLQFACRIAVLSAINERRRDIAEKRAKVIHAYEVSPANDPSDPEQQPVIGALAPIVRELLDTLPEPLAEALALHVILGYGVADAAEVCHVPLETQKTRLRLVKQALRKRVLGQPLLREVAEVGRD